MKLIYHYLTSLIRSRRIMIDLIYRDFQSKYLGSYLGIIWAFIQPTVTVLIFWFVFQVGFKSVPVDDYPFVLWLTVAMVPWFFFSDAVLNGTNSIIDSAYLVKKVVFRVSLLPVIKLGSALFVHLFFIVFLLIMFLIYGYGLDLYILQLPYYLIAMIILIMGLNFITSSLIIFLKDVGQIVAMLLQFGFWLTPIFYSLTIVPEKFHFIYNYNPVFYITEGYRNSLVYKQWFWEEPQELVIFWVITIIVVLVGALLFRKLRPHFADVL